MRGQAVAALLALLVPAAATAQTISGLVLEEHGSTRIPGAAVELVTASGDRMAQTQTDRDGLFVLRPGRDGVFVVRLSHLSYAAVQSDTLRVSDGEALIIQLRMSPTAIALAPLEVVARGDARLLGFYQRMQRGGAGRFLSRSELATRPGARVTQLLQEVPGIYLATERGSAADGVLYLRSGARTCAPWIYVDGIRFRGPIDSFLMPSMLEGVEIYHRAASVPSEFLTRGECGVIAFWTQPGKRGKITWARAGLVVGVAFIAILLAR